MTNPPAHPLFAPDTTSQGPSWLDEAFPAPRAVPTAAFKPPRARLQELDPHFHCPIIGTCLGTADLRKLVPKFSEVERKAGDLEIHHAAVQLASQSAQGSKALNKLLDTLFAADIKRFQSCRSVEELQAVWNERLKNGEVPGAYWAIMTHPLVSAHLQQRVFGEVHMLSHLVGAANRADIRRLIALEEENARLKDKADRQQQRLHQLGAERDALMCRTTPQATPAPDDRIAALEAQVRMLEAQMLAREQLAAHHEGRSTRLEEQLRALTQQSEQLRDALRESRNAADEMRVELNALDRHLTEARMRDEPDGVSPRILAGKRIVYAGGRPHSTQAIASMVKEAGGELILHDGGIEERRGLLPSALAGADLVLFPVDCISHNSVTLLKRACERHQIPYHPLRTASMASFMAFLSTLEFDHPSSRSCAPASHLCLRHG